MKTKYFRFLYFGRKGCLVHVGEIEDTRMGEQLVFLYLDGSGRHGEEPGDGLPRWGKSGAGRMGYPGRVDVLIVGDASENTEEVLREILAETSVDEVICPRSENLSAVLGEFGIVNKTELDAGTDNGGYRICRAGWILCAASLEAGSAVLLHGFQQGEMFDDCVMNVSVLDGNEHRGWWKERDGFAAAMRCTVHHDYDACRCLQQKGSRGYRVSSLLCGKTSLALCLEWMRGSGDKERLSEGLRFLPLPSAGMEEVWDKRILDRVPEGYKCYYVSGPGEPAGKVIGQICQKSPYQIPVVTGEGTGVCCAGFLKYAD